MKPKKYIISENAYLSIEYNNDINNYCLIFYVNGKGRIMIGLEEEYKDVLINQISAYNDILRLMSEDPDPEYRKMLIREERYEEVIEYDKQRCRK